MSEEERRIWIRMLLNDYADDKIDFERFCEMVDKLYDDKKRPVSGNRGMERVI